MAGYTRGGNANTNTSTTVPGTHTGAKVRPLWDLKFSEPDPADPSKLIFHKITGLFPAKMKDGTDYFRGTVKADDGTSTTYFIMPVKDKAYNGKK
jgi:hypothetical protein